MAVTSGTVIQYTDLYGIATNARSKADSYCSYNAQRSHRGAQRSTMQYGGYRSSNLNSNRVHKAVRSGYIRCATARP